MAGDHADSAQREAMRVVPKDARWSLLLRSDDKVAYKGAINSDTVGAGSAQLLYPAPNAAGLLAAVITHGLIVQSVRNSEKEKQLEAANSVLQPYQGVLDGYRKAELMRRGLEKASANFDKTPISSVAEGGANWLFESTPVFSMTQDQRAIVLDNNIAIYPPGTASAAALQYTVKVVSPAGQPDDPVDFWTANQGEMLKETSANLFAQSLDIAVKEAASGHGEDAGPYKTVRYREGGSEKIERAQIIDEHCGRLLLKTLRGWLMSVPIERKTSADSAAPLCDGLSAASPEEMARG